MKKLLLSLSLSILIFAGAFAQTYNCSITAINTANSCKAGTAVSITGTFKNNGTAVITSAIIKYDLDGGTAVSQTFTVPNCAAGGTYDFTFTTTWTAVKGTHKLTIQIPTVNGNKNSGSGGYININVWAPGKPVLVEYFTSPSCHYCAQYDPTLEGIVTKDKDYVVALSYQVSSPGPDPMYNSDNGTNINTRFNFYGLSGVPQDCVDGFNEKNGGLLSPGSENYLNSCTSKAVVMQIDNPYAKLTGNSLTCSATAKAVQNVSGTIVGFIAVTEELITSAAAAGTNGQTSWHWVVRKMLPNGAGTLLTSTSMSAGATKPFSGSWTLSNIYDKSQVKVVFFVQNTTTKEVYWSYKVDNLSGIKENSNISFEDIYPNPAKDIANVNFKLIKPDKISLRVYDMLGKTMLTQDFGLMSVGDYHIPLNIDNLITGMYFVELNSVNGKSIKKISVFR